MNLTIDDHPLLDAACFLTTLPAPLGRFATPPDVEALLRRDAPAPLPSTDDVRTAVRNLLRHGGFKPTGRSKPASEYLLNAAAETGALRVINAAVDAGNAVSLHSGLPISVVDAELAAAPWRIGVCPPGTSYVFNPSGQSIDVGGLVSLFDAAGPCAGPVKDSQRTKTHDGTTTTLSIIWGSRALPGRTAAAERWYRELLERAGARTSGIQRA